MLRWPSRFRSNGGEATNVRTHTFDAELGQDELNKIVHVNIRTACDLEHRFCFVVLGNCADHRCDLFV